ncbi:MAG: SMP-30/gluconolactonase/LRE family protein [Pseudomonadota bacterium]
MVGMIAVGRAECVLDAQAQVGEGAVWCADSQRLLWVDVWQQRVHRYDPATGHDEHWVMPQRAGCVAPAGPDQILVGLVGGFSMLTCSSGALAPYVALDHAGANRCNDSVVDPAGRLWCGTMPLAGLKGEASGQLFSLDGTRMPRAHMDGLTLSNGLACAPDGRLLYLSDSHPAVNRVWVFDLDPASGELGGQRLFLDGAALPGRPDGATVDADGCYWICAVDGWSVLRITPQGRIDRRIALPVSKPSKVAIGGARLDTLFITSISSTLDAAGRSAEPLAGGLFALHVGPIGVASPVFKTAPSI